MTTIKLSIAYPTILDYYRKPFEFFVYRESRILLNAIHEESTRKNAIMRSVRSSKIYALVCRPC